MKSYTIAVNGKDYTVSGDFNVFERAETFKRDLLKDKWPDTTTDWIWGSAFYWLTMMHGYDSCSVWINQGNMSIAITKHGMIPYEFQENDFEEE